MICEMDKHYISYAALAKLLGLARRTVSEKMRGEYNFTAQNIAKLVEIFDKPAEYLIARDDGLPAITSKAVTSSKSSVAIRQNSPYKNLLREMDKHYISYTALGELLGLSHQTTSDKMRGKENFTAEQVVKLVEIFGKPAEYLTARDDGLPAITSKAVTSSKISMSRRHKSPFKNLIDAMAERQLLYAALAKLLGLSSGNFSNKIRGNIKFTEKEVVKLVEIFGLTAEYLMQRDD